MELKEFVELLMTKPWEPRGPGHTIRKAFFRNPMQFMDCFELKAEADRALVSSLDPDKIAAAAGISDQAMKPFVKYMREENHWPLPGKTHAHPWMPDLGDQVCNPVRTEDDLHNLWSGPKHEITKLFTDPLYRGESNEVILMGQSILPGSTLRLEKMTAETTDDPYKLPPITLGSDELSYHCCSIRQTYVRTMIDVPPDAPKGAYRLSITNKGWNGAVGETIQIDDRQGTTR